jgi:hypothetical protein
MKGLSANAASPFIVLALGILSSLLVVLSLFLLERHTEAISAYTVVMPVSEEFMDVSGDVITDERYTQDILFNSNQPGPLSHATSSSEAVPLADSPDERAPVTVWQDGDSWSLTNITLSLIGFMEALIVMSMFFVRSWKAPSHLFRKGLMLRMPVLVAALICLVATGITSDFTQPLALFDKTSLPIAILFVTQQLMLPGTRIPKPPVVKAGGQVRRFRAEKRYES